MEFDNSKMMLSKDNTYNYIILDQLIYHKIDNFDENTDFSISIIRHFFLKKMSDIIRKKE